MADYYPVLSRAIAGLPANTAEARRAVYERARQAIVKQLRSYDPPLSESEITKERLGLEEAVRRIESDMRNAAQQARQEPSGAGLDGLSRVHAAAAEAASLGAATASAQASANTTRAAFASDQPRPEPSPRLEPKFERRPAFAPAPPARPMPPPRPPSVDHYAQDEAEPADDVMPSRPKSRLRLVAAVLVTLLVAGAVLAGIGYFGAMSPRSDSAAEDSGPKIVDRLDETTVTPGIAERVQSGPAESFPQTAAATAPEAVPERAPAPRQAVDPGSLVGQRAILYEEAPDRQGGNAFQGSIIWTTQPVPGIPNGAETQLRGEVTIPERNLKVVLVLRRNLDTTLPASHTIDIQFTLPPDFAHAGIGNVPGILFKPTEEAGGSALTGLSVKVMSNFFLVGLSDTPADRAQNLQAIRERGWIDVPILYENGRRAVLTLEKGPPGERAFADAFAAWDAAPPIAANTPTAPASTTP